MNDIFFTRVPAVGDDLLLETWTLTRDYDVLKEPVGNAKVVKVETRTEPEWNPVFRKRRDVENTYVTLDWNGKLYVRRCILGGVPDRPATWSRPGHASQPPVAPDSGHVSPDSPSPQPEPPVTHPE